MKCLEKDRSRRYETANSLALDLQRYLRDEPVEVPRVARLLALALRFEQLVQSDVIATYAELARLGHVSRARVTQILNLRLLAPDNPET